MTQSREIFDKNQALLDIAEICGTSKNMKQNLVKMLRYHRGVLLCADRKLPFLSAHHRKERGQLTV
jgi:hypothetical protein